jgi:uncharacterized membrane protein
MIYVALTCGILLAGLVIIAALCVIAWAAHLGEMADFDGTFDGVPSDHRDHIGEARP